MEENKMQTTIKVVTPKMGDVNKIDVKAWNALERLDPKDESEYLRD